MNKRLERVASIAFYVLLFHGFAWAADTPVKIVNMEVQDEIGISGSPRGGTVSICSVRTGETLLTVTTATTDTKEDVALKLKAKNESEAKPGPLGSTIRPMAMLRVEGSKIWLAGYYHGNYYHSSTDPGIETLPKVTGLHGAITNGKLTLDWDATPSASGYVVLRYGRPFSKADTNHTEGTRVGTVADVTLNAISPTMDFMVCAFKTTSAGTIVSPPSDEISVGNPVYLHITTASLPGGTVGVPYSQTITSAGGKGPIQWGLKTGPLPPGLTMNATGTISGSPTKAGTYKIEASVTDRVVDSAEANKELTIVVAEP